MSGGLIKGSHIQLAINFRTNWGILGLVLTFFLAQTLAVHLHPYRMYWQDLLLIFGVLLLLNQQNCRSQPRLNLPLSLLLAPMLIVALILLQSVLINSVFFYEVGLPVLYLIIFSLSTVTGTRLASQDMQVQTAIRLLAFAMVWAGIASVFMQFIQLMAWDLRPLIMSMPASTQLARPFANVAQPNQLALLFCMSLAAIYWQHQTRKIPGHVAFLLALLIIAGLVLTQSRIAWIILPLMTLLIATHEWPNTRLLLCLGGLLLFYLVMLSQLDNLAILMGHSGALAERLEGRSERKILWLQALRMVQEHPWLGVGWAGFGPAQVAMAADFTPSIYSEHAHNLVLNLAAEIGIPATLLICAGLAYWCLAVFPKLWPQAEVRFLGLCLMAVAVHSMVEFPLWYGYILFPVGVMMGILHQLRWPGLAIKVPTYSAPLLSVFAIIAICFITYDYLRVVNVFRAYQSQPSGQIIRSAELRQPAWTLFPQFYHYFDLLDFKPRPGLTQAELNELAYWTRRFGFVHTLNTLAESYVLNDQIAQARRTMLTILSLHPWRYAEYYDYWQARAVQEPRFAEALQGLPARDAAQ